MTVHFLVTAFDGDDIGAMARRLAVRERHLEGVKKLIKERRHLYAAAILDDEKNMIGSVMIVDYPSRKALEDEWLKSEPYVTGGVWKKIDVRPCEVPDFFLDTGWARE